MCSGASHTAAQGSPAPNSWYGLSTPPLLQAPPRRHARQAQGPEPAVPPPATGGHSGLTRAHFPIEGFADTPPRGQGLGAVGDPFTSLTLVTPPPITKALGVSLGKAESQGAGHLAPLSGGCCSAGRWPLARLWAAGARAVGHEACPALRPHCPREGALCAPGTPRRPVAEPTTKVPADGGGPSRSPWSTGAPSGLTLTGWGNQGARDSTTGPPNTSLAPKLGLQAEPGLGGSSALWCLQDGLVGPARRPLRQRRASTPSAAPRPPALLTRPSTSQLPTPIPPGPVSRASNEEGE